MLEVVSFWLLNPTQEPRRRADRGISILRKPAQFGVVLQVRTKPRVCWKFLQVLRSLDLVSGPACSPVPHSAGKGD